MEALRVSQINEQIKSLLESTFLQVRVEGEISRVTYHTSGHVYFSIKDEKSTLSCVMFRSNAARLKFRLEEGQHVVLGGAITVYVPRGNYQMMVQTAEPYGEGALSLAFEQLKKKLAAEGLFDAARKKPIPRTVRHIVLVTSKTGAAVQDMVRVASKRWPLVKLTVVDTLVQGAEAAGEIARHLLYADRLGADVIVLGRGGGSREHLWAFNEEAVARAVAACRTPVVSAVGHEIDTVISDFVADMRAPTPSAAMEQILPDRYDALMALDETMERMGQAVRRLVALRADRLRHLHERLAQQAVGRRVAMRLQAVGELRSALSREMGRFLAAKAERLAPLGGQIASAGAQLADRKARELEALQARLQALDPSGRLPEGSVQLLKNGRPVPLATLKPGEKVRLSDAKKVAEATIDAIWEIS